LEVIAHQTGWHIFVEPEAARTLDVKFSNLPSGEALKKMLGDLNFAFVPKTNGPSELYVFVTVQGNATHPILAKRVLRSSKPKRVPNQLIVKLKPGADIEALAKRVGAKVVGRDDKLGVYLLQFDNDADMQAALGELKGDSDVQDVDYNYYYDLPTQPQSAANLTAAQPKLTLDDSKPGDPCQPIVAVIDTQVQSLGSQLDQFVMPPVSVVGNNLAAPTGLTHGTAMVSTVLNAISQSSGGHTGVKVLPVVIYDSGDQTTTWNVALGVQAAVNNGASVLNMSLGGTGDSSVLDDIVQQAEAQGVVIFAAAGNQPVATPTYPAALPGVNAVTALSAPGQLASYANYGSFSSLALPGTSIVAQGGQTWMVQGTSSSTAYASGIAAGTKSVNCGSWSQIESAMQQKFPVPQNQQ
ncbi:MAG TPA: S8 family serine peptidase, partial [Candidatus Sulfotelmatobacter sp.]|nr:S8 family serine peptidase [Candidatus Sulfotelmatobacter sp.]